MKVICLLLLCTPLVMGGDAAWESFKAAPPKGERAFAAEDVIARLNAEVSGEYVLGPGDILNVQVFQQPELSGTRTIGPDGMITLPLLGDLRLGDKARSEARTFLEDAIAQFYKKPVVTLEVSEYHNNNIFVLGQLSSPGLMRITGRGTLLEALTQIPVQMGVETSLSKCAVIRGSDKIIWVDLHEMLHQGNLGLNLKLANNDVLYLPFDEEPLVYVMGAVNRPGAYRLKTNMSFLDALMGAGGPTINGRKNRVELVRRESDEVKRLTLRAKDLRKGNLSSNVLLAENDIIYVGTRPLAHINYWFSSVSPFANLVVISEALSAGETRN